MARTLKFRAWHLKAKKMFSAEDMGQDQLTLMPDGRGFANIHSKDTRLSAIDDNQTMIPLQFTGLLDKNNREVFEGDIIKIYSTYETDEPIECKATVSFSDGGFKTDFHGGWLCGFTRKGNWECEVIGTIYENPELIGNRHGTANLD